MGRNHGVPKSPLLTQVALHEDEEQNGTNPKGHLHQTIGMDGYPPDYVGHNLPFIILFGLGSTEVKPPLEVERDFPLLQEKGIYISSELPSVTGSIADDLLKSFHEFDARDASWNNRPGRGKMGTMGFTYRTVGRAFTLPPRKANAPSTIEDYQVHNGQRTSGTPASLHSPLSPLTPDSPTFPDGIFTPLWFSKHQCLLPSAMISFFNFTMDMGSSTLQDNRLKSEINALRTSITSSSYKFRLVVVLVAEAEGSEMLSNDRLANIRRGTNLDPRSLFLLPYGLSTTEIGGFVGTVLASLQPSCMEYYRDLSKHARRKRNRSSIPPPTAPPTSGTSQTLSIQGWNVRYETKLGYFAEFRQEMDAAGHNYEAAYENLVEGEVFESTASWSPRFNETRMLADVLAIRILRCLLWTSQTTSATVSWANHRYRMLELVDRQGKGSATYGWQAWEARWSSVMAELIERVGVPIFHVPQRSDQSTFEPPNVYLTPEKSFEQEDRLPPWDLLHHEGYWYRRAAQRTRARRKLALTMPKEDRNPPGSSPASTIASRSHLYDTYMCPEPHLEFGLPGKESFDHSAILIETLGRAAIHFSQREQKRAVERAGLEIAQEHMRSGRWLQAWTLLGPLWRNLSWRKTGWWMLVEEVSWAVRACARHLGDGETLVAAEWELLSDCLNPRANWQYDFSKCLDGLDIEETPHAVIDFDAVAPCMSASFTFGTAGGHVGELVPAQLTVVSHAHAKSAPILVSEIELTFDGGLRGVLITHSENAEPIAKTNNGTVEYFEIAVASSAVSTALSSPTTPATPRSSPSTAELVFKPQARKVFLIQLVPRDSGEVRAAQTVLSIREAAFYLDVGIKLREQVSRRDWWQHGDGVLSRQKLDLEHHCSITILPKPPKLQIELPTWKKTYYIDEKVVIPVHLRNEEADIADIRLHINLLGIDAPRLEWSSENPDETDLEGRAMGQLPPGDVKEEVVSFHAGTEMVEYSVEIRADYILLSDPNTPISKSWKETLSIITPFEANYDFLPRIHPEPWPNYFSIDTIDLDSEIPRGLKQHWIVSSRIGSFATESLIIRKTTLKCLEMRNITLSSLAEATDIPVDGLIVYPNDLFERSFNLELQKLSLNDHRASTLTFELYITWERVYSTSPSTSSSSPINSPMPFNPLSPLPNPLSPPFASPKPSSIKSEESEPKTPPTTATTITTQLTTNSILVPPLSLPAEPRLICSCTSSPTDPTLLHLTYTLENPSLHLLTFQLAMEASEEFAFSGPKSVTTQLVPLSRTEFRYCVLPTRQGVWIKPGFKCVDLGFGRTLKALPGEGCRVERGRGLVVWAVAE